MNRRSEDLRPKSENERQIASGLSCLVPARVAAVAGRFKDKHLVRRGQSDTQPPWAVVDPGCIQDIVGFIAASCRTSSSSAEVGAPER